MPTKWRHFLTQCLFCFFAEDVGLLPGRMFEGLGEQPQAHQRQTDRRACATCSPRCVTAACTATTIFRGSTAACSRPSQVPPLERDGHDRAAQRRRLNWSAIDVSIFGTLFERGLDPDKRSQLGAHYTDPATIARIVEPVLQRPLLQIWEQLVPVLQALLAKSTKERR